MAQASRPIFSRHPGTLVFRTEPMSDEREFVTLFDLVRWALPTALVLLGVIFFFLHPDAAPAVAAALTTP
jgi:hypothetical protein